MNTRFALGDVVVRREILLGEVWFGCPTICVGAGLVGAAPAGRLGQRPGALIPLARARPRA